jgi:excisionase family DNA binding protein
MTDSDDTQQIRKAAIEEIRAMYPPLLTTAHVAELLQCTIGDVRDKIRSGDLPAIRWGQQFRFFRDEVLAVLEDASLDPE